MFLIKEKRKYGTNLCIVHSYRDPVTKVSKTKRVMNIGYLEDLEKQYDDPIAHFKQVAAEMNLEYEQRTRPVNIDIDPNSILEPGIDLTKNLGYAALSAIYHELKLDVFFRGRQRGLDIDYSLNSVMKLLVYGSILYPGTIKQIYSHKDKFFEKMDFTLDDVYRSFKYFHQLRVPLQGWIHDRISENYGRDTEQMYYYLTKHYFEANEEDRINKNDPLDKNRMDPVVQMGLFVDKNGLPVSYELMPRNPGDALIIRPALKKRAQSLKVNKIILVGDNGVNSTDTLYPVLVDGNGYIVSQSVRDAEQKIKDYTLNCEGYTEYTEDSKVKSRTHTKQLYVTQADGRKRRVSFDEKQVMFYNRKYSRCIMAEREAVLLKAKDLIASPGKYNKVSAHGPAKYVRNINYDEKTGQIVQGSQPLYLDKEGLKDEERYDGYYLFSSSETDMSVNQLVDTYSDLWEIEESFKYVNSTYNGRPVFTTRLEHMHAHFTTCFVSLLLTRILEMKISNQYPMYKVLQSLRNCNHTHIDGNHYVQSYYDQILETVGEKVGVDFSKRYRTLSSIRETIGATKKR